MHISVVYTITLLYYIVWPIIKLLHLLLVLLTPIYHGLAFLLQPIGYLGSFVGSALGYPFVLLARFETMYIYVGVAILVGIITGGVLHGLFTFAAGALRIRGAETKAKGPTAAQHRAARRRKKLQFQPPNPLMSAYSASGLLSPSLSKSDREGLSQRGLLAQTIAEEDDSDF
ncbi:hypothetical protein LTR04_005993 [Oleoguttula sp. CCFEE 6159]|nr:hypothetical protein LTR04_005993 [Oleoguttula sp. CCFEE 6159]